MPVALNYSTNHFLKVSPLFDTEESGTNETGNVLLLVSEANKGQESLGFPAPGGFDIDRKCAIVAAALVGPNQRSGESRLRQRQEGENVPSPLLKRSHFYI